MKILHTSDWHIGHKFYGRHRTDEFISFFDWLSNLINKQTIDALFVSGDIFDSQTPSNSSLELYYSFLSSISQGCCRHIVITGGNHDSPAVLEAPDKLLRDLNIHVIARAQKNLEDEILLLKDKYNVPELMVLAVPYLRDREIRSSEAGESHEEKQQKLVHGIYNHYAALYKLAEKKRNSLNIQIPLLATGHLFCRGGKTDQGDGVRELYVGNLVHIGLDCFSENIDYLALGHLHRAQRVGKMETRRYSGSPLTMTFAESDSKNIVLQISFTEKTTISEIAVPCFQRTQSITGKLEEILTIIKNLGMSSDSIFLEINYTGNTLIDSLQEQIYEAVEGTNIEVLCLKNKQVYNHVLKSNTEIKTLDELTPEQVFSQCLLSHQIPEEQQGELRHDFAEILSRIAENDSVPESNS